MENGLKSRFKGWFVGLALAASTVAVAATYEYFQPATGVLVGDANTYVTTAATSVNIRALWSGTCNASSFLRGDGACAVPTDTGLTSVGLTMPSGFSVANSPLTSNGTINVTTTLNGVLHGNGSAFTAGNVNLASEVTGRLPFANLTQGSALSVLGVTGNVTADFASIAAGTDNQVLRRSGTALAFGQVNLASTNAVTGALLFGNGGTGLATAADDTTMISSGSAWVASAIPNCQDSAGNHLNYNTTTNALSCGTSSSTVSPTGANPTASAGLTAVNGSANTFLRSDGAPAISQSIAPTWTGAHNFSNTSATPVTISAATTGSRTLGVANTSASSGDTARIAISADTINVALFAANSAQAVALVTGGPTGAQGVLRTLASTPLIFGTANTFAGSISATDQGMVWGAATGGSQGAGTINAQGIYVNGVSVGGGSSSGTFTFTLSGCTTSPTAGGKWAKTGSIVTINVASVGTCTSNATTKGYDASIPVAARPVANVTGGVTLAEDNGTKTTACIRVLTTGAIDFDTGGATGLGCAGANWTNSGTFGLPAFVITYQTAN